MLEVWGRKNSNQVIHVMWTVGELNLDYKRHNVGGSFGGLKNEDYKKLNPNLYIPTIKDGNFVLWESYAIIRYLSKKYGYGSLWPKDICEAALADQWIEWFQETLMPKLFPIFWNKVRVSENDRDNNKIEEMVKNLNSIMEILEKQLDGKNYIIGDSFTMGDIPVGAGMFKYFELDITRPSFPNIEKWYSKLCQREAYKEHAMNKFGTNPNEWLEIEKKG